MVKTINVSISCSKEEVEEANKSIKKIEEANIDADIHVDLSVVEELI